MRQKQKQTVKQSVKQSVIINLERRKRRPRAKGKQVKRNEPMIQPAMVQYYPMQVSYPSNPMSMFTQEQFAQKMDTLKAEILEKVKKEPVAMPFSKYLEQHDDERYLKSIADTQSQISVLGAGIPRERTLSDLAGEQFQPSRPYRQTDNFEKFQEALPDEPHPSLAPSLEASLFPYQNIGSFETPPRTTTAEIKGERIFDPVPVVNPFTALSPVAIETDLDEPEVRLEDIYRKPRGRPKGSVNRPKDEIQLEKKLKQLRKDSKNPLGTGI